MVCREPILSRVPRGLIQKETCHRDTSLYSITISGKGYLSCTSRIDTEPWTYQHCKTFSRQNYSNLLAAVMPIPYRWKQQHTVPYRRMLILTVSHCRKLQYFNVITEAYHSALLLIMTVSHCRKLQYFNVINRSLSQCSTVENNSIVLSFYLFIYFSQQYCTVIERHKPYPHPRAFLGIQTNLYWARCRPSTNNTETPM